MAFSSQLYTGDGIQTSFSFGFPYLEREHVFVNVDGVDTSFTFLNDNLIDIVPAPADQSAIEIYRSTPTDRLVDYLNGSIQDAEDFDLDSDQLLYLILETKDLFEKSLSRLPVDRDNKMYQNIDMNTIYKIVNSAEPVDPTDLVRVQDVDALVDEALVEINVPDADEDTKGALEVATQVETDAGTADDKIVTPLKLANYSGLGGGGVDFANQTEVNAGVESAKAVAPDTLGVKLAADIAAAIAAIPDANTTTKGLVETATTAEVNALTAFDKVVTPGALAALAGTKLDASAYTAADVLAKLLTVDTDTSGLNANTLQGQTAAQIIAAASSGVGVSAAAKVLFSTNVSNDIVASPSLLDNENVSSVSFSNSNPIGANSSSIGINFSSNLSDGDYAAVVHIGGDGMPPTDNGNVIVDAASSCETYFFPEQNASNVSCSFICVDGS